MALFTNEEINNFYTFGEQITFNVASIALITEKLKARANTLKQPNHVIPSNKFNTIYCTSDIHSDFRKFTQMLILARIVASDINPYDGDNIYRPEFITGMRWIAPAKTILVIIGDLVDGRRASSAGVNSPDDRAGSFELLLFTLLYNLRIQANQNESEIRFTIGNHEHMTVISQPADQYDLYVADEARRFFGNENNRRNALLPFIFLCPYFLLTFQNGHAKEIACIHGGLHHNNNGQTAIQDITAQLEAFQLQIDTGASRLTDINHMLLLLLWSRVYKQSERSVDICDIINHATHKLIIVGHCTTNNFNIPDPAIGAPGDLFDKIHQRPEYANCDKGVVGDVRDGCVLLHCHGPHGPRLAFVDVALSKGQRMPSHHIYGPEISNKDRNAQLLRLRYNPELKEDDRHFNQIERVISHDRFEALYLADPKATATTPAFAAYDLGPRYAPYIPPPPENNIEMMGRKE